MRDDTKRDPRKGRTFAATIAVVLATTLVVMAPTRADADEPLRPPVVRLGDVSIVEGSTGRRTAALQLALSRPVDHDLTVAVVTRDGSATSPSDYVAIAKPKSVKIRAGRTATNVSIAVNGDTTPEPDEQLVVEITGTTDAGIIGGATGTVTILDDEATASGTAPELGIGGATVFEGSGGKTTAKVPITLSRPLSHDVSFTVYSLDGTAVAPSDYKPITRLVRIAAGRVSATAALPIAGDTDTEYDEELTVRIVDVSDDEVVIPAHELGAVVIRDDEPPPPPGNIYSYIFGRPVMLQGPDAAGWVRLAWDEPEGGGAAETYDLELSRDNATWYPLATTSTRSFDHYCGLYFQVCQYRVTPRNAGGTGPTSWLGSVYTQGPDRPGVPQDFMATHTESTGVGLVSLSWRAPTDGGAVERYQVDWLDPSNTWQEIYYGANPYAQHDCGLELVCSYRLTPINASGDGPRTETSVTNLMVPGVPTFVDAQATSESRLIALSWSPPEIEGGVPITGYQIRYTDETDGSGQPPVDADWTTIATFERSATIDSCGPGGSALVSCWIQVRAENAVGPGPWSAGTAVDTWVTPAPGPIADPQLSLVGPSSPGWVQLRWSAPATGALASYAIEVSRDGSPWQVAAATTDTRVDHYCGTYLLTCRYQVTATNAGGTGPATVLGTITTQAPTPPGTPAEVRARLVGPEDPGLVIVEWDRPADGGPVQSYGVEHRDDLGNWQMVYVGADMTARHWCGVARRTCEYRVVALNAGGETRSTTASVTTQGPPSAPPSLSGSTQTGLRRVELRWAPPRDDGGSPVVRYRVRRTTDLDANGQAAWNAAWTTVDVTELSTSTVCSGGPRPLVTCRFEVRAENALGAGPWSAGAIVGTYVAPPHDPKPGGGGGPIPS